MAVKILSALFLAFTTVAYADSTIPQVIPCQSGVGLQNGCGSCSNDSAITPKPVWQAELTKLDLPESVVKDNTTWLSFPDPPSTCQWLVFSAIPHQFKPQFGTPGLISDIRSHSSCVKVDTGLETAISYCCGTQCQVLGANSTAVDWSPITNSAVPASESSSESRLKCEKSKATGEINKRFAPMQVVNNVEIRPGGGSTVKEWTFAGEWMLAIMDGSNLGLQYTVAGGWQEPGISWPFVHPTQPLNATVTEWSSVWLDSFEPLKRTPPYTSVSYRLSSSYSQVKPAVFPVLDCEQRTASCHNGTHTTSVIADVCVPAPSSLDHPGQLYVAKTLTVDS